MAGIKRKGVEDAWSKTKTDKIDERSPAQIAKAGDGIHDAATDCQTS
jgi:hypothetical protein